jgi:diguanylate cyclase (GGDEF)-like protein
MMVAMAVVIALTLPGQIGPEASDLSLAHRMAGRFGYSVSKLMSAALFVIGARIYAFGGSPGRSYVWGALLAAITGAVSVLLMDEGIRTIVVQAPGVILAFGYCGGTLLRLPNSRRSLGSRVTGGVFATMAAVWIVWFTAYTGLPGAGFVALERLLENIVIHNGYVDALLQMLLGSGMVVMLMEDAKREADDARAELAVAHDKLRRDALYDSLTDSLNRRAFAEGVGLESARASFGAVVVLDMDNLKTVNDSAGHAGGDELLQYLATTLRGCIRPSDRLYRWGGDEFLLLFPGARGNEVQARVEQAIAAAEPLLITGTTDPVCLVASVGSADYASAEDLMAAIERADGVMYRQKKARRTKERAVRNETPAPERKFVSVE